jgi:nucleoside-diphosphate-sugar epimerase
MRILVTGSSGFIGTQVVQLLKGLGYTVLGLDRRRPKNEDPACRFFECDILDASTLGRCFSNFNPEVVVHLAAKTSLKEVSQQSNHYAANTVGTVNLMREAKACGGVRRILFTSTKYVYRGFCPPDDHTYKPHTSYGRSKAEMERLIWEWDGGCSEWCIVRPTTIWGPGMGPHYRQFLRMVRDGRYVHVGSTRALKHMGYIRNVAYQYGKLIEATKTSIHRRVLYATDYEPMIVPEWANAFQHALRAPPIKAIPTPIAVVGARVGDLIVKFGFRKFPLTSFRLRNLTIDDVCEVELMRQVCGDLPYSFDQAIQETVEWFLSLE